MHFATLAMFFSILGAGTNLCEESELRPLTSLEEAWALAEDRSPMLTSLQMEEEAQQLEVRALKRERFPDLMLLAEGDGGQRISPSEERALGPSVRGHLQARGDWILFDSSYQARQETLQAALLMASSRREARRSEERQGVSGALFLLLLAEKEVRYKEAQKERLEPLLQAGFRRADAGVEPAGTRARLERKTRQIERDLQEAYLSLSEARAGLAIFTGQCFKIEEAEGFIDRLERRAGEPSRESGENVGGSAAPEIRVLLSQADTLDAEARQVQRGDRFTALAFGSAGLFASRAYEQGVKPELFVGLSARWRPDLFGVRSAQAATIEYRASAAREQALGAQREAQEQAESLRYEAETLERELRSLQEAMELQEQEVHRARRRWEQGVSSWTEPLDALDELADLQARSLVLQGRQLQNLLLLAQIRGAFYDSE